MPTLMVMGCPPEGNENETAASGRQSGDFTANRPLALAGNLSDFGRPGCESVCAVHYLPLDAHGTAMAGESSSHVFAQPNSRLDHQRPDKLLTRANAAAKPWRWLPGRGFITLQ